jgi:DNA-binding NarL/FixJ family response regulator
MAISLILVDDHAVVRDGLRLLLEVHPDIRVVGSAADGHTAVALAHALRPDVVVMDIALPDMSGIDATQAIRAQTPTVQVLILSMHATADYLHRALAAGASGYVLKDVAGTEVAAAVRSIAAGTRYFSRKMLNLLVDHFLTGYREAPPNPLAVLSPRELDIIRRVIRGHSSKEIAATLSLSPKTVETYRARAMEKLGLHDIPALVKLGMLHGLDG